jgi:hypothetical protein
MEDSSAPQTSFAVSRGFQFLYLLPLLLAAALLVQQVRSATPDGWLALLMALALAGITVPRALARVEIDGDLLTLRVPLRSTRQVELANVVDVERSARIGRALILRYRPLPGAGEHFLGLPPLEGQEVLEQRLRAIHAVPS